MIIHPEPQGSLEWLTRRAGVVTASEFDQIMTADFEARSGEMPKTYLARKLAEWWLGGPLPSYQSIDMDNGELLETEVLPFLRLTYGWEIQQVGLITDDSCRIGASPDGLISDDIGVEIKAPRAEQHVKYLMAGVVPRDYRPQVYGSLYVTGRREWRFVSYRRRFPCLTVSVSLDDETRNKIGAVISDFLKTFEKAKAALEKINGGPPKRPKPPQPQPAYASDQNDVPTP